MTEDVYRTIAEGDGWQITIDPTEGGFIVQYWESQACLVMDTQGNWTDATPERLAGSERGAFIWADENEAIAAATRDDSSSASRDKVG
ncbi:hypothetical protein [Nonomuraea roseola]|uniref:Uncharacterized protein n=1 Tax=Nonomuraea roseola TaxID=46179 RepID=A0ABV5QFU3_9ACTN